MRLTRMQAKENNSYLITKENGGQSFFRVDGPLSE